MRKITIFFACIILCCNTVKAQYADIPDSIFRETLKYLYPSCMNAAGQLDTTCSEILSVEELIIRLPLPDCSVTYHDLTGLQYFKNLRKLDISDNPCLETFPLINSLKELYASNAPALRLSSLPNGLKVFTVALPDNNSFNYVYPNLPFINDNGHLPDSLEYLSCRNAYSGGSIPLLPAGLKHMDISAPAYATGFDTLPPLPSSLKYLNCQNLWLNKLPQLPLSLTYLNCSIIPGLGRLTQLPALPPLLDTLDLNSQTIKQMPELPASLKYLSCTGSDSTTSFPALPEGLKTFYYNYAPMLAALPPLPNSIVDMKCSGLGVTNLPSLPTSLNRLVFITDTMLTSFPAFPAGLTHIECGGNRLTSLPALPSMVDTLSCNGNALESLPTLPGTLTFLDCSYNKLTSIPRLNDGLVSVTCYENKIQTLERIPNTAASLNFGNNNLTCLPTIPPTPSYLRMRIDDKVQCVSNMNPYLILYKGNSGNPVLPKLCNPTNNPYRCAAFPVMAGYFFYDANNNGIKDADEMVKKNAKLTLSSLNNSYTFSNDFGYYEIQAENTGSHTITPVPWVSYFDFVPASASYTFISYDTIVYRDFVLHPNTIFDSLSTNIINLNRARPGFPFVYLVNYENTGTTTLADPAFTITYDSSKLIFDSISVQGVTHNGNTLSLNINSVQPFRHGNFFIYCRIKPIVAIGDSLVASLSASTNSLDLTSLSRVTVRGAFDPNDKNATPQLSPSQVSNGDYIDYTIRFQNTGTDTAFNIIVTDTLNENLQANSLQVITSSHNCKTTVKDNIVYFEFLDILLPDSNVNELKSHGFVSFRIQPEPTVAVNTTIPNSAAIYFDYNAPVITNTAGTLIKEFVVVPLKLVSFSAVPQNDNTTILYWKTVNEINTKQFIIERSNDGLRFSSITNVVAKGKANNNYNTTVADANTDVIFYRLKMIDNDGNFTYSPIIKIDRRKNTSGIAVMTNPVKDFMIINTNDRSLNNTQCNIINTQGVVVKNFIIKQGSQVIDIKGLSNGVYYLRTANGNSRILIQ